MPQMSGICIDSDCNADDEEAFRPRIKLITFETLDFVRESMDESVGSDDVEAPAAGLVA